MSFLHLHNEWNNHNNNNNEHYFDSLQNMLMDELSPIPNFRNRTRPLPLTESQQRALLISKGVFGGLSFALTFLFVVYVILRSLYTFPWRGLFQRLRRNKRRPMASTTLTSQLEEHATRKRFLEEVEQECFIFSRPITRIFFFLQLANCVSISQIFLEVSHASEKYHFFCMYQAILVQYFGLAKIFWSLIMAIWMFWILVVKRGNRLRHLELCSHIAGWSFPLLLTVIPWAVGSLGDAGGYCWIRGDRKIDVVMRFVTHFVPFWISVLITCVLCGVTLIHVIRTQRASFHFLGTRAKKVGQLKTSMKLYMKLFGLPFIYVLVSITPSVLRMMEAGRIRPPFWFLLLNSFFAMSQGLWNTVVFVLSEIIGYGCDAIDKNGRYLQDEDLPKQYRWDNSQDYSSEDAMDDEFGTEGYDHVRYSAYMSPYTGDQPEADYQRVNNDTSEMRYGPRETFID